MDRIHPISKARVLKKIFNLISMIMKIDDYHVDTCLVKGLKPIFKQGALANGHQALGPLIGEGFQSDPLTGSQQKSPDFFQSSDPR